MVKGLLVLSVALGSLCTAWSDQKVRLKLDYEGDPEVRTLKVSLNGQADIVTTISFNTQADCYESGVISTPGYTSVSQIELKPQHHVRLQLSPTSPVNLSGTGVTFLDTTSNLLVTGNCNYDHVVDIADYSILASAFDATPGVTNWDPEADLNMDDIIDIADYSHLAANFDGVGDDLVYIHDDTYRLAEQISDAIAATGSVATVSLSGTYYVRGRITMSSHVADDFAKGHVNVPAGHTVKFVGSNNARILAGFSLAPSSPVWEAVPNSAVKYLPFNKLYALGPPLPGVNNSDLIWKGGWGKELPATGSLKVSTFSQPYNGEVATSAQPFVMTYDGSSFGTEGPVPLDQTAKPMEIASDKVLGIASPWRRTLIDGFAQSEKSMFKHLGGLPNPLPFSSPGNLRPAVAIFPNADYEGRVIPITSVSHATVGNFIETTVQMDGNVTTSDKSYLQKGCRFRYLNDPSLINEPGEFAWTSEGLYVLPPTVATKSIFQCRPTFPPGRG